MLYLNILLIGVICVCIVDISGFIESLKYGLSWILTRGKLPTTNYRLKPIDCSLCCSFWSGLIYLIVTSNLSIMNLVVVLLVSISTPLILETIYFLQDTYINLLKYLKK